MTAFRWRRFVRKRCCGRSSEAPNSTKRRKAYILGKTLEANVMPGLCRRASKKTTRESRKYRSWRGAGSSSATSRHSGFWMNIGEVGSVPPHARRPWLHPWPHASFKARHNLIDDALIKIGFHWPFLQTRLRCCNPTRPAPMSGGRGGQCRERGRGGSTGLHGTARPRRPNAKRK